MLENLKIGVDTAALIKSLYQLLMGEKTHTPDQTSKIVDELHPVFEQIHFNYIEIFRFLDYELRSLEFSERNHEEKRASKREIMKRFSVAREELEYKRDIFRQNIGAMVHPCKDEILGKYVTALAIYFLHDDDRDMDPIVINVFYKSILDLDDFARAGDKYFDTPSMRVTREILQEEDLGTAAEKARIAIAGLGCKRQNIMVYYYAAKGVVRI